jgi:ArsR family transcriptional regulator
LARRALAKLRKLTRGSLARARSALDIRIHRSRSMDVNSLERHAGQLAALGHVARLSILRAVVQAGPEGVTTTALQERLDIPWTTLNHHLDRLVDSRLVAARKEGKSVFHTADYVALRALTDFLWEDCCKLGKGSAKIASACCAPSSLTGKRPVQLGKKSRCC